jgi:hypothetical protein
MKRPVVSVSADTYQKLRALADFNGWSMSDVVARIADDLPTAAQVEEIRSRPLPTTINMAVPLSFAQDVQEYAARQGYPPAVALQLGFAMLTRRG